MREKNIILWDLDGTLTDPGEGITKSVAYALDKFGIAVPDLRELYCFIGPPLLETFMERYAFPKEQAQKAIGYFREYFTARGILENQVYPGVALMLKTLKESGRQLILATSKPEVFAVKILKYFDLAQYFDAVVGSTLEETRSHKYQVIAHILSVYDHLPREKMVMVGDRKHDVEGAHKNGLPAVGVLYGYGSREELEGAGADRLAGTVEALCQLLLEG